MPRERRVRRSGLRGRARARARATGACAGLARAIQSTPAQAGSRCLEIEGRRHGLARASASAATAAFSAPAAPTRCPVAGLTLLAPARRRRRTTSRSPRLAGVTRLRPAAVRGDVVDLRRRALPASRQRALDRRWRRPARRVGREQPEARRTRCRSRSPRRRSSRRARAASLELLEHEERAALAEDGAVAVAVVRGGRRRRRARSASSARRASRTSAMFHQKIGVVEAAAERHVGLAAADGAVGASDRVRARHSAVPAKYVLAPHQPVRSARRRRATRPGAPRRRRADGRAEVASSPSRPTSMRAVLGRRAQRADDSRMASGSETSLSLAVNSRVRARRGPPRASRAPRPRIGDGRARDLRACRCASSSASACASRTAPGRAPSTSAPICVCSEEAS